MAERSNVECCWDDFRAWMKDEGRSDWLNTTGPDDWLPWFRCWCSALDAMEQTEGIIDIERDKGLQ